MSIQDTRSQHADASSPSRLDYRIAEMSKKNPNDVEVAIKSEVNVQPAIEAPIIAQLIEDELEKDELFPEGGLGWLAVLGCFMLSSPQYCLGEELDVLVSCPGFGLCWGVFQEYYRHHILVGTSDLVLGSTQGTVGTISSLFIGRLGDKYGYKRFTIFGPVCSVGQFLGAAFGSKLWHFFLAQVHN
ncbi:hypothetical protein RSOLAG22IIIB_09362 [Rhizoctonia solani]|uniref:Uncharacterized protein n=1 Tax=Rhizoctonia solani TaxID=456999 RepID=A0A0K6FYF1_9AGAM|nr:hypothetical protein RSOLAG22IIIB_09362 [Rhizoctonia solani]